MATKTHGMKLALTSSKEIMSLMNILNELEALYKYELKSMHFEDIDFSEYDILKTFNTEDPAEFIEDLLRHLYGIHHQRILWNCATMLKHCADPALSYLDFNPEIKEGFRLLEERKEEVEKVSDCSLAVINYLSNCNISKNHTGRWGVIFGRFSRTYHFMHEEKEEVLKWIRDNYDSLLKKEK